MSTTHSQESSTVLSNRLFRLLSENRFAVRALVVEALLLVAAWAVISTSDGAFANVVFGMLVATAGLFGLLLALVGASMALTAYLRG